MVQSQIFTRKNEIDSSVSLLNKLLLTKSLNATDKIKGQLYLQLGFNYFLKNETIKAMESYTNAMKYFEQANDENSLALTYCKIAALYSAESQYDRTLEYLTKAKSIADFTNDNFIKTSVYSSLTGRFLQIGTENKTYLDSTIFYGQLAMNYVQKNGYYTFAAHICNSVSSAFLLKGNMDDSFKYLLIASTFSAQLHKGESIITYFNLCDFYLNNSKYNLAQTYLDTIFSYAYELNDPFYQRLAYERQYIISKQLGQNDKALTAYEHFTSLNDSLFNEERNKNLNEITEKYESELKDSKIENLEQQKKLDDLNILVLIIAIILTVSTTLLLILLYLRRNQKQQRKLLETELRLNRLRINPHFFFNLLGSIQSLTYIENKKDKVPIYISKLSKIMRKSLESSFSELTTIEEEIDFIKEYADVLKVYGSAEFELKIDCEQRLIDEEFLIPSMLIQPYIENSIEHGFKGINYLGLIEISITTMNKALVVLISDNGSWKEKNNASNHVSRATQITTDTLHLLKKKFSFPTEATIQKDVASNTTIVRIILPLLCKDENTIS